MSRESDAFDKLIFNYKDSIWTVVNIMSRESDVFYKLNLNFKDSKRLLYKTDVTAKIDYFTFYRCTD